MATCDIIVTNQPQHEAQAVLFGGDQDTVLWDECRLIWDSASLVTSDAAESEVCVFGAEGKYYDSSGVTWQFRFHHCFEFEPIPKYVIRLCQGPTGAEVKLVDVVYGTKSPDGGKHVFEDAVQEMTNIVKLEGPQKGLQNILRIRETSGPVNCHKDKAAISEGWQSL